MLRFIGILLAAGLVFLVPGEMQAQCVFCNSSLICESGSCGYEDCTCTLTPHLGCGGDWCEESLPHCCNPESDLLGSDESRLLPNGDAVYGTPVSHDAFLVQACSGAVEKILYTEEGIRERRKEALRVVLR